MASSGEWSQVEGVFGRLLDLIDQYCVIGPRDRPEASVIHHELESILGDLVATLG